MNRLRRVYRFVRAIVRWEASPIPLREKKPKQLEIDWHTKAANGVE